MVRLNAEIITFTRVYKIEQDLFTEKKLWGKDNSNSFIQLVWISNGFKQDLIFNFQDPAKCKDKWYIHPPWRNSTLIMYHIQTQCDIHLINQ